jgi:hypothetical protein
MSAITIVGKSQIGSPLKLAMTDINNQQVIVTSNDVSHVQWYKNGVIINGATSLSYTPTSTDQLAVLTADVTLKSATTSLLSDQRAIDAQPITDTLLWTNSTAHMQFTMDTFQTVAKAGAATGAPIDMQNMPTTLVTIDADHNGAIMRFNSATDSLSVSEQNITTGQVQQMTYPVGLETPAARLAAGFRIVSTDLDVNHDGRADILSVANNQLFVNQSLTTASQLLTIDNQTNSLTANGGYVVKGVADFNGDGNSDILLFNASHNSLEVLQMNGTTVSARTALATLPTGYSFDSIGDSTGDGKADIMIRDAQGNLENYQTHLDQVNGKDVLSATLSPVDTGKIDGVTLGTIPQDYKIIARPDFNADGKADILWQNTSTGTTHGSVIDGNQLIATNVIESYKDWNVKAVTTDVLTGKLELIFQQDVTGNTAIVDMAGVNGNELGYAQVGNYGSAWQIDQADQISTIGANHILPSSLFGI